jgi:hypothetical protein
LGLAAFGSSHSIVRGHEFPNQRSEMQNIEVISYSRVSARTIFICIGGCHLQANAVHRGKVWLLFVRPQTDQDAKRKTNCDHNFIYHITIITPKLRKVDVDPAIKSRDDGVSGVPPKIPCVTPSIAGLSGNGP